MSNIHPANRNFTTTISWRKNNFVNLLVLAFFGISFIGILNHEMWRDELQAWLIARDSSSIINLFENLRYEGHPGLWHLGLYIITRFTGNPFWMQIYHLIIATSIVYVFVRFSPFTKLQKIMFSFGYFTFYEYSIISRNYAIGILLLFTFCALFTRCNRNYILLTSILALMANTNIYGTMIAIAIGATLVFEIIVEGNINSILANKRKEIVISIVIFLTGIGGAIIQVLPPPDRRHGVDWHTTLDIERLTETANNVLKGYLLALGYTPLSTNWGFTLFTCFLLITIAVILVSRNKKALFLYIVGTCFILLFSYTKYLGAIRHHGNLFMLLIACLWISSNRNKEHDILKTKNVFKNKTIDLIKHHRRRLISLLMCVHLAIGVPFFIRDLIYPFSASKATASYIAQDHRLNKLIIVGYSMQTSVPIAGLLNREIYYPQKNSFGSFVVWKNNIRGMTTKEILAQVGELNRRHNQSILLIMNSPLDEEEIKAIKPSLRIFKEAEFTESIDEYEKYHLYVVSAPSE